jgi:hypothetical protein
MDARDSGTDTGLCQMRKGRRRRMDPKGYQVEHNVQMVVAWCGHCRGTSNAISVEYCPVKSELSVDGTEKLT